MAQQGFVYEQNVAKYLKPMGLVPKSFIPAGAGHDQPDLMLEYRKKKAGCELKITDASAGSLVLKYNPKKGEWSFGTIADDEKEKLFIKELAEFVGLFKEIKKRWSNVPWKVDKQYQDAKWLATAGKKQPREQYERDHKLFPELKGEIPAIKIEQYYNRKDTYYVNIGTHGFYLFGSNNPLGLVDVPRFSASASAGWRARVQSKGGGAYQFTFEMSFRVRQKSPYNIGALKKSGGVVIQKSDTDLSCFDKL
jgi:hypothetical protein